LEEALVRICILQQVFQSGDLFDLLSDLFQTGKLGLEDLVRLVVLLHEQRVLAVGLDARDVGAGMQTDCVIHRNSKRVGQVSPGGQHLVEEGLAVVGSDYDDETLGLEGEPE